MFQVFPNARLKPSPFYDICVEEGMTSASLYNSMIMPSSFGDREAEYWRLIEGVSQWDVGVQRQVQLKGPDAARLAQRLAMRDLSTCAIGQGKYVALCNAKGTILNDPIIMKLADDLYWMSIADSDMWLWSETIAMSAGYDVEVSHPDVSPMALQGPKAEDVVAHVLGDWVRDLKYFWFRETEIAGIPVVVQRSGYSKQGGFEIYLCDGTKGSQLWRIFKEAGQPWGIGPGSPQTPERTESGLLSIGSDTDAFTNPFEVRMARFTDLTVPEDTIGLEALQRVRETGPARQQLGLVLEGDTPAPLGFAWEGITLDGDKIGDMTNCIWSPRMKANIGFALISSQIAVGTTVTIQRPSGPCDAKLVTLPFL
ncbi:glycine cleavage T C-terminal barrel domain-containing protein [Pacificoceanicola onchidii]|uniref:glycine cleavage T C-terminal barrel domain-containing protein n=1 Tax=Pacificoceanicola onchidii TaxID=2562685 RepID=UPI0010A58D97|nr:glycine cleavage T C-terminal barrel domain-containing protein [Pacificoceanicola onchidii]